MSELKASAWVRGDELDARDMETVIQEVMHHAYQMKSDTQLRLVSVMVECTFEESRHE